MTINDKELMDWVNSFPSTEETLKKLDNLELPELDRDPEFVADLLKGMATEDILRAMEEEGLNRNQLAQKMGKSRQYIGRVLNESANFTLERLAEFACALGRKIAVRVYRDDEVVVVKDLDDHGLSDRFFKPAESKVSVSLVSHQGQGSSRVSDETAFYDRFNKNVKNVEPANEEFALAS